MLTCLARPKRMDGVGDGEADEPAATPPSTKRGIHRILRVAGKASIAYNRCNPCSGPARGEMDTDAASVSDVFSGSYIKAESSNLSTKLKAFSTGSCTPASTSCRTDSLVFMEENGPKEWVAQVEPGVLMTFVSTAHGENDLKKIRFSRDLFDKRKAQRWWAENYDKVMELYNVQRSSRRSTPQIDNSEDCEAATQEVSASGGSSCSASDASERDSEWVEQDEPGVYITVGVSATGSRELRRVRFSRDRFGEKQARLWWEENKARIQRQYL